MKNRNLSLFSKNCISKRKHHSNSNELLDYIQDTQGFRVKKRSKNSKLSMAEAIVEKIKLNHVCLIEEVKTNKE